MSLKALMASDLPAMYEALADTTATFAGENINVMYEDDYDIEGVSDRTIKVQSLDVIGILTGSSITMDSKSYTALNFRMTDDGLETIIMLNKV